MSLIDDAKRAFSSVTKPNANTQTEAQKTPAPAAAKPAEPAAKQPQAAEAQAYAIKEGDTLWDIATKANVPLKDLVTLNNIKNPDLILAGATIKIPAPQQGKGFDPVAALSFLRGGTDGMDAQTNSSMAAQPNTNVEAASNQVEEFKGKLFQVYQQVEAAKRQLALLEEAKAAPAIDAKVATESKADIESFKAKLAEQATKTPGSEDSNKLGDDVNALAAKLLAKGLKAPQLFALRGAEAIAADIAKLKSTIPQLESDLTSGLSQLEAMKPGGVAQFKKELEQSKFQNELENRVLQYVDDKTYQANGLTELSKWVNEYSANDPETAQMLSLMTTQLDTVTPTTDAAKARLKEAIAALKKLSTALATPKS
jgi:LysM repeat protein